MADDPNAPTGDGDPTPGGDGGEGGSATEKLEGALKKEREARKAAEKSAKEEREARTKAETERDAGKTDLEKITSRVSELEEKLTGKDRAEMARAVADAKGLPPRFAERLKGSTQEEMEADADDLLEDFDPVPSGERTGAGQRGGGEPKARSFNDQIRARLHG